MLTLSRKIGESVVLYTSDGEITVTLKETSRGLALSFDAPEAVEILRAELLDQCKQGGLSSQLEN